MRGLVRVIRAVTPAGAGPRWAAFHDARGSGRCGRFAIIDASGTAFVDDDCFEIWNSGHRRHGGALEDGRTVEVIGPAALTRLAAGDAVAGADPYRAQAIAVSFDGTPTVPVIIVAHAA